MTVKSPGRINLIGEHIDYNGGHVLPAAINLNITIRFKKREGSVCNVSSKAKDDFKFNIYKPLKPKPNNHWANYVLGVINGISKIRPQLSSLLLLFQPITATILGAYFFSETLLIGQLIGVIILLIGIYLAGLSERLRETNEG